MKKTGFASKPMFSMDDYVDPDDIDFEKEFALL